MQNINIKNSQEAAKAYGAYAQAQSAQSSASAMVGNPDAFDAVEQVQYDRTAKVDTNAQTVMDHFEEYRRDMQEKAKSKQQQEVSAEEQAREDAKEIARSLSTEEIKQLRSMGIDVSSASLADLMDIVNTMRDQAHKDALANVLAQAQIEEGDVSNLVFTSTGPQIAGTDVDLQVGNKEILYLLKNKMPLNQETLYRAHYSGQQSVQGGQVSGLGEQWQRPSAQTWKELPETMQTQLQHIVAQAGIPVDDQSLDGAAMLLANDIPVTTDSMRAYVEMQTQLGISIEALPTAEQTVAQREQEIVDKADKLQQAVGSLTETDIVKSVRAGKPLTIAAMLAVQDETEWEQASGKSESESTIVTDEDTSVAAYVQEMGETQQTLRAVTAMRQLEELRLSMTQQAAIRLLKQDINIDTRDLSQVVAKLRNVEAQMTRELFAGNGVEATQDNISVYTEMQEKLQVIGDAPAAKLGLLFDTDAVQLRAAVSPLQEITVRGLASLVGEAETAKWGEEAQPGNQSGDAYATQPEQGAEETIRRPVNFAAMEREYDALGTAPRMDMGDSIRKAFANVDAILQDMQLPVDAEHTRAVRILGYNAIPITEENLQQVLQYDREVNELLTACQPNAVLSMIRDGINPLDLSVDELNQTLREKNYRAGVKETEDFATFLRDVERRGEISPKERSGYIGMYRVLKKLEQSGDREAGYLFANGSRLTVRNLITAMRSRKAAGMDISVDDAFGMLETVQTQGTKMDAQIEAAFARETDKMRSADANPEDAEPAQEMEDVANPWTELLDTDDALAEAEQLLQAQNLEESAVNLQAAAMILHGTDTEEHTDIYNLLEQAAFESDSLLEQLGRGGDLSLTYADLQQQLVEQMYTQAQLGNASVDFRNLKLVHAGFRILGAMAKRQRYQLPVATETGTKLVNLTLQTGTKQFGTIDIQLPSGRYGMLSAHLYMGENGQWKGSVCADTSDGNTALQTQTEALHALLAGSAYADADIALGQNYENRFTNADHTATKKLCEASVFFVKALAQLSDK